MFPANTMGILSLFVRSCAIKVRIIFSSNSYLLPSQVRRMFNKADKNKDGKLTPEEWRQVLNSSGVPTSMYFLLRFSFSRHDPAFCYREEVEDFFSRMDRDFDGRLSFEEFMGEESPIEKLFKNMDKNGDGVVTKQVILIKGIR